MSDIEQSISGFIQLVDKAEPDLDQMKTVLETIASRLEPFKWTKWERGLTASRDLH